MDGLMSMHLYAEMTALTASNRDAGCAAESEDARMCISQWPCCCREGRDVTGETGRKSQWGKRRGRGRRDAGENGG